VDAVDFFIWFGRVDNSGDANRPELNDKVYVSAGGPAFEILDFSFTVENPPPIGSATTGNSTAATDRNGNHLPFIFNDLFQPPRGRTRKEGT
jgi:hypothetical protein